MHLLKAEEILRIHDAVLERFGGLNSQPMAPDAEFSKAQALVGRIRTAMTYNTAYDWNNVFLCAAFQTHCIARAHAFADGNKRTALNAAGLLLKRAGYAIKDSENLPLLLVEVAQDSTAVSRFAIDYIKDKKPALVNVVFDVLDHVGHAAGHDTPAYYTKLEEIDGYVGQIVQAMKDAGIWEESIIIVTADHGGIEKGHGGRTMQEMETPFIICGKHVKKGIVIEESMMQFDVASTIASIFGIQQPQVWIGRPMPVFE